MNIYALVPFISVIAYMVLIGLVATRRPLAKVHKVFIFYLAVSMLWSFTSFILHADYFPTQTIMWHRILIVAGGSTTIIYYHFMRTFFNKSAGKMTFLGYAGIIGLTIFVSQGGMLTSSYVVDGILYFEHDIFCQSMVTVVDSVFLGTAIFYLVQGFRRATNPQDRNRLGYLLAAVSIWVLFMATNFVPTLANYSVDHIGNIANTLIIGYAVLRYQLLDIRVVARRALVYFLVVVCLTGIYSGAVLLGHMFFPGQPFHIILLPASALTLLLAFLARPLRHAIQEWVDRFFYGGTYHYRQTLLNFSSKMGSIINLNELADEMLLTISKALSTPHVKLLFEDASSGDFTTQFTYPQTRDRLRNDLRFGLDNPVVTWLEKESTPLDLKQIDSIPQLKGLRQTEREGLVDSNLRLLCPIKSRGKLIGILAMGSKLSGSVYLQEDMELVMSMANQAGIIMENARMFDSIKKQQTQVEQLLARAVLAQEEERERISADLHDSVAQWLAAASYRVQTVNALLSGNDSHEVRDELTEMENTIDTSLKELRRIVIGLRPPVLDELGLTHALQLSLKDLKADGLNCRFIEIGEPGRLPSNVEITVYRAVQEALTNIRKHANATKVSLRLQYQPEKFLVEVRDNGRGFDLSQTLDSAISVGHMGLLGMKQRAETLGGGIKIKTSEDAGTTITLNFPIQSLVEER